MTGVPADPGSEPGAPLPGAALQEAVARLFAPLGAVPGSPGPERVGMEVEVLPLRRATGRPALPRDAADGPGTVELLRRHGCAREWTEVATPSGLPAWELPEGGRLSFEPGGQIEYSTRPEADLGALDAQLHRVLEPVGEALDRAGIDLLARGLDPGTPLAEARMVLEGARYPRQQAHYDRRGPEGRTMMLQTAGIHVNLDLGPAPRDAWTAANLVVPHLVALFANAPERVGHPAGHRSHRAALWRVLDPTRNRAFPRSRDPHADYLAFALSADAFLLGDEGEPARPFSHWWSAGASRSDFQAHLTTLFPEVRPRGYLEVRPTDALPLRWCIVPAAVGLAAVHAPGARARILAELPDPTPDRLERAGRLGLGDPALRSEARWLRDVVTRGLEELGRERVPAPVRDRVEAFFALYLDRGRDPGHAPRSLLQD